MIYKKIKLKDICSIKTGKKDVNEGNSNGKYPFFTCAKEHTFSDTFSFDCEAILVAGNGAVGQTTYFSGKFEAYQRTYVLTNFEGILPRLLLLILNENLMKHLSTIVLGNTIPYIKKDMLENFELVLPPLSEQKRILSKLDLIFTEINKIKLRIESQDDLSKKLFTNYLNSIFQANKYESFKIGDIPGVHSGGTPLTTNKEYWDGTIPWYSSRELNDYATKKSIKRITKLGLEKSNAKIFPKNSLLIGIYDTAAMKMSILHQDGTFNQAIVGIPPNSQFETEYLFFVLNYLKDTILLQRKGVRQMNLSLAKIKDIKISKPPLEEQKKIIYSCNEIKKQIENLENIFCKKLDYMKLLKKSFLNNILSSNKAA